MAALLSEGSLSTKSTTEIWASPIARARARTTGGAPLPNASRALQQGADPSRHTHAAGGSRSLNCSAAHRGRGVGGNQRTGAGRKVNRSRSAGGSPRNGRDRGAAAGSKTAKGASPRGSRGARAAGAGAAGATRSQLGGAAARPAVGQPGRPRSSVGRVLYDDGAGAGDGTATEPLRCSTGPGLQGSAGTGVPAQRLRRSTSGHVPLPYSDAQTGNVLTRFGADDAAWLEAKGGKDAR